MDYTAAEATCIAWVRRLPCAVSEGQFGHPNSCLKPSALSVVTAVYIMKAWTQGCKALQAGAAYSLCASDLVVVILGRVPLDRKLSEVVREFSWHVIDIDEALLRPLGRMLCRMSRSL